MRTMTDVRENYYLDVVRINDDAIKITGIHQVENHGFEEYSIIFSNEACKIIAKKLGEIIE
jgi:hypothetical protein